MEKINCDLCGQDNARLIFIERGFNIVECCNCGLVYVNPRYRDDEYKEKTNLSYKQLIAESLGKSENVLSKNNIDRQLYINSRLKESRKNLKEIEKIYKIKGALLDVGCGEGFFLKTAKDSGWKTTGIDMSVNHQPPKNYGLNIITQNFLDTDIPETSFNVLTFFDVLEHLPYPGKVIEKAAKLLTKDGIIVIRVPNEKFLRLKMKIATSLFSGDFYLKNRNLSFLGYYAPETHFYNFNQSTLKNLLEINNFKVLKVLPGKFSIGAGKTRFIIHNILFFITKVIFYSTFGKINYNCSIVIFAKKP